IHAVRNVEGEAAHAPQERRRAGPRPANGNRPARAVTDLVAPAPADGGHVAIRGAVVPRQTGETAGAGPAKHLEGHRRARRVADDDGDVIADSGREDVVTVAREDGRAARSCLAAAEVPVAGGVVADRHTGAGRRRAGVANATRRPVALPGAGAV